MRYRRTIGALITCVVSSSATATFDPRVAAAQAASVEPVAAVSTTTGTVRLVPQGLEGSSVKLGGPAALGRHPSLPILYAAPEWGPKNGRLIVLSYAKNQLRVRKEYLLGGLGSVHVTVAPDGAFLAVSQYTSGTVAFVRLDGSGLPLAGTPTVKVARLQPGAKAHAAAVVGAEVLVTDLANGRIEVFDASTFQAIGTVDMTREGPRSLAVLDDQRVVVSNELSDSAACLSKRRGTWTVQSRVSLVQAGRKLGKPADVVRLGPNTVAVADRGLGEIVEIAVANDCALTISDRYRTAGPAPRALVPIHGKVLVGYERDSSGENNVDVNASAVSAADDRSARAPSLANQPVQSAVALR